MLALAFPDRVARNRGNGSFLLANGRGAAVEQTSSLAREPYLAVAELTGTAAQGRILLAAPIAQEEIETRFADQIEDSARRLRSIAARWRCAARRKRTLHAITLSEAPVALSPSAETARIFAAGLIAAGLDKLPWSKSLKQWRDRVMFLRKAEGESWPDLSDAALAADGENWLVPAALRQDLAEGAFGRRSLRRADGAAAVGVARAAGARSADAFRGADRHHARDRLRGRAGADALPSACRNCSGSTPIPRSPRARCRWCWNCCRRRSGRCR